MRGLLEVLRPKRQMPVAPACTRALDVLVRAEARAEREALYRELRDSGLLDEAVTPEQFGAELTASEIALVRRTLEQMMSVPFSGANPVQACLDEAAAKTGGDAGAKLTELYRMVFEHAYESHYWCLSQWVTLGLPDERLLARQLYIRLTTRGPSTDKARQFMTRLEAFFLGVRDRLTTLFAGQSLV